jgi:hypothetical protein
MPKLRKNFLEKILANLASVKVWILIAAVALVSCGVIWSEHFRDIIVALIAAREIWKVTALRQRPRRGDGADDEK